MNFIIFTNMNFFPESGFVPMQIHSHFIALLPCKLNVTDGIITPVSAVLVIM